MIRPASLHDIYTLVNIENQCFGSDILSRRSFRYLLTKGHAHTLVDEQAGTVRGYAMVLLSSGTSMARLYSLAVDPGQRRQGVGSQLLDAAEHAAQEQDCVSMRLEARRDNREYLLREGVAPVDILRANVRMTKIMRYV